MPLETIPFQNIGEADLLVLVTNQEREGKNLEFKESLPGNTDSDKKEFLADVTSFANTSGGHLVYGVSETAGFATEVRGLTVDADAEIGRMESLLRSGVQPRVPGYSIRPVPLRDGKTVIIFRINQSWILPHRVILGGHDKFYARNSSGKYPLDVPELRSLFALSETTGERIKNFRVERIAFISSGQTPVSLPEGPKTVLHLTPLNAFTPGLSLNVAAFENNILALRPLRVAGGWSYRHNFDGIVTFSRLRDSSESLGYLQVFRNGIIEAVDASSIQTHNGQPIIPGGWEDLLLGALPSYFSIQIQLGIQPPVFIMLSLIGIKGYYMYVANPLYALDGPHPIDREMLLVPEVLVDNFSSDPAQLLKQPFDVVWNAAGFPGSVNYDQHGNRVRR